ncbi:CRISPR-associated endoribonuclease Cas6 domain-containing protein [Desulfonema limicola]|uniref:CRISPR-associated endoribonuclease Cas6 domain-containing protein n=1 Tax=Desulfonema limicola TaxID=45656 RepID=A0A975BAE0_9BACT|nr:CRISPR system precrRNA processing endoribonuclease RAMP protein Cas6 [Desulfonema limicola]QTA81758.1 CRISPR-associated endoribonuclease Cas6 domain-containing protein [Desulfonema limicola]
MPQNYEQQLFPLLSLPVSRLKVDFSAVEDINLTGIEPVLRGRIGDRIKRSACLFPDLPSSLCGQCDFKQSCLYIRLFAPLPLEPVELPGGKVRHVPSPVRPFVLGLDGNILKPGQKGRLILSLFGPAIGECVFFLKAVMGAVMSFPLEIETTSLFAPPGDDKKAGENGAYPLYDWIYADEKESDMLELELLTPLNLVKKGRNVREDLDFLTIIQAALRRLRDLKRSFNMDGKMGQFDDSFYDLAGKVEIIENNLGFRKVSRYSARQDQDVFLDGLAGKIAFKGNFQPFMSLIRAAEIVHIGKGSSNGNGRISII